MEVKFKSIPSTSKFVSWLKGFKDVHPSMIIEVDIDENAFIAKCFPQDKTVVKYSKISFEEAGYELAHVKDNNGEDFDWTTGVPDDLDGKRIKLGIYEILNKLIEVENMFSETEHELIINFDINHGVTYMESKSKVPEYQGNYITNKSMSLTMTVKCSELTEFFYKLDDDTFINRVCNISSPSNYEVSVETLNNLYKIASVFAVDKSRDIIKIYSKDVNGQRAVYVYDETNGSFDYLLGYFKDGVNGDNATFIFKEKFINATKGLNGENLIITLDTAGASRILITDDDAKIIVAAPKNVPNKK